jgi:hypothetical protein
MPRALVGIVIAGNAAWTIAADYATTGDKIAES